MTHTLKAISPSWSNTGICGLAHFIHVNHPPQKRHQTTSNINSSAVSPLSTLTAPQSPHKKLFLWRFCWWRTIFFLFVLFTFLTRHGSGSKKKSFTSKFPRPTWGLLRQSFALHPREQNIPRANTGWGALRFIADHNIFLMNRTFN